MLEIIKTKTKTIFNNGVAAVLVPDGYEVAHVQVIETSLGEVVKIVLADKPVPEDKVLATAVVERG